MTDHVHDVAQLTPETRGAAIVAVMAEAYSIIGLELTIPQARRIAMAALAAQPPAAPVDPKVMQMAAELIAAGYTDVDKLRSDIESMAKTIFDVNPPAAPQPDWKQDQADTSVMPRKAAPVETDAISDWVSSRLAGAVARSSAGNVDDPSRDELISDIAYAENQISEHIEKYHDFDYEPHQVPEELESLRRIMHHLAGALYTKAGEPVFPTVPQPVSNELREALEPFLAVAKVMDFYVEEAMPPMTYPRPECESRYPDEPRCATLSPADFARLASSPLTRPHLARGE